MAFFKLKILQKSKLEDMKGLEKNGLIMTFIFMFVVI